MDAELALAAGDLPTRLGFSALGERPLVVREVADAPALIQAPSPGAPILVGVDAAGALPSAAEAWDVLLTTAPDPPAPWTSVGDLEAALGQIAGTVARAPVAAGVAAAVLRAGERMDFAAALTLESLAYSTLLGGAEFRRWRTETPRRQEPPEPGPPVGVSREGAVLRVVLSRPHKRNALSAAMRDGLCEALGLAALDPSIARVELSGEGANFCAGGDFAEFGSASDLAAAHVLRVTASAALAAHRIEDRLTVTVHGATVGGGLEIAAAAGEVRIRPDAQLWLPEVSMGLIPGAGGTVTVPRRIGRQRALYMMLTQARIDPATALAWGLADGWAQ